MQSRAVILLVEDEVLIRLALADALREDGYHVLEAANADEALQIFDAAQAVHLVISDVKMPGSLDGLELVSRLRLRCADIPVILMSAALPPEAQGMADAVLRKPFPDSELVTWVRQLTGPECRPQTRNGKQS